MKTLIIATSILLTGLTASAQDNYLVSSDELSAWAHFLASDQMKGRANGSIEMAIAAGYIAAQFEEAGLKPAPGMDGFIHCFRR